MAKTVIHLPHQITSRWKEKKRNRRLESRTTATVAKHIQVTAKTIDTLLTLNSF